MPTLNWIGKDRVVNHAVPFHVLERVYNFGGATDNTGNESRIYNDRVNAPQIKRWIVEVVGREGEDLSRHDK